MPTVLSKIAVALADPGDGRVHEGRLHGSKPGPFPHSDVRLWLILLQKSISGLRNVQRSVHG